MQANKALAKRKQRTGGRRMAHAYLMEPQAAKLFLKIGEPAIFRKNTVLFEGNSTPDRCFFVRGGFAMGMTATQDGAQHFFGMYEPGSIILCQSLFAAFPMPLSIVALTDCDTVMVRREAFLQAMQASSELRAQVLRMVSGQYLQAMEFIRDIHVMSANQRLCMLLLRLLGADCPADEPVEMKDAPSQQMLADILDVNRITVVRAMKRLKASGVLLPAPVGPIRIKSARALQAWAEQQL